MYWEDGKDKRILYTAGTNLFALDANTGKPVTSFGVNGSVDLHVGLGSDMTTDVKSLAVTSTTPGVIYKNTLILVLQFLN
jgi:quinoprotein glucose dehydrogenase